MEKIPTSTDKTISQSKKARAMLIALANINIIVALASFSAIDASVSTMAIQAIMFLAGLFLGVQGGIDFAAAWKIDASYKNQSASTSGQTSSSSKG